MMKMDHKRYDRYLTYKHSGIEWLGMVPEHWKLIRLKYCVNSNEEKLKDDTDPSLEIEYLDIGSVSYQSGIVQTTIFLFGEAPSRARRKVHAGDTIVSTVRTYLKAIAKIEPLKSEIIVSTGFAVLHPKLFHDQYLYWYCLSDAFLEFVEANAVGVSYPSINPSEMLNNCTVLPPLEEQTAIASFLDRETARVDALVAKKQRFIELLKEKRSALISRAVTRGIDATAKLKDSGVAWLGMVPEHWELKRLKFCVGCNEAKLDDKTYSDFEFEYVDIGNVKYGLGVTQTESVIFGEAPSRARRIVKSGDTIVSTVRTYLKAIAKIEPELGDVIVSTGFAVLRPKLFQEQYLYWYCQSDAFVEFVEANAVGVSYPSINPSEMLNNYTIVPPVEEQTAIASFLDHETARMNELVMRSEQVIEKLSEYRRAIISAAVTGKIKVS